MGKFLFVVPVRWMHHTRSYNCLILLMTSSRWQMLWMQTT